jgi:hypothetical protein
MKRLDSIRTGEDQPVESIKAAERSVERRKRGRLGDLNRGNRNSFQPSGAKLVGQRRGLVWRAGDENARSSHV